MWWFGYTISTLVLGLALLLFAPGLDAPLTDVFRRRMGGSFGFGAAIFFLLPIAAVLLLVVVVTIPLGLFLLLALALLYTLGYVAGAHVLGRQLVKPPSSRFLAFLIGWMILRGIGLDPGPRRPRLGAGLDRGSRRGRARRPGFQAGGGPARAGAPDPRAALRRLGVSLGSRGRSLGRASASRCASTRITPIPMSGRSWIMLSNSRRPMRIARTSPSATSEAIRGPRVIRDISPTTSPGPRPRDLGAAGLHADRAARDDQELVAQLTLGREELAVGERTLLCDLRDRAQVGRRELVEQGNAPQEQHAFDRRHRRPRPSHPVLPIAPLDHGPRARRDERIIVRRRPFEPIVGQVPSRATTRLPQREDRRG